MTSSPSLIFKTASAVLFLGSLSVGLFGCGRFEAPYVDVDLASKMGDECSYIRNSKGQRVSWNKGTPVSFYFEETFPEDMKSGIQSAIADWANATGIALLQLSENTIKSEGPRGDKLNIIYWNTSGGDFNSTEQAKTTSRWSKDQLIDTDIVINAKSWMFFLSAVPEPGGYLHLESLMVHEFGHALGLLHLNSSKSVMYPYLSTDTLRTQPQANTDISNIHCEYE